MNSIINAMPKYNHRQHVLSDWLAELDQRFQLGEVGEDTNKITWWQLLIGATGSGILSSLDEEATWEDAKEALLTRLGIGSVRDEAWAALRTLKKRIQGHCGARWRGRKTHQETPPQRRRSRRTSRCERLLRSPGRDFGCRSPETRT